MIGKVGNQDSDYHPAAAMSHCLILDRVLLAVEDDGGKCGSPKLPHVPSSKRGLSSAVRITLM